MHWTYPSTRNGGTWSPLPFFSRLSKKSKKRFCAYNAMWGKVADEKGTERIPFTFYMYTTDSMKGALGIGNCPLGSHSPFSDGPQCYYQLQKYWDTVPYFGINGLSMILCSWSPLHPLSKLPAIQDHTQNLEEQLWMGGRREVSIISHRPVTRSDFKQERSFFRGSASTFLQLVVACLPPNILHNYCFQFLLGNI